MWPSEISLDSVFKMYTQSEDFLLLPDCFRQEVEPAGCWTFQVSGNLHAFDSPGKDSKDKSDWE